MTLGTYFSALRQENKGARGKSVSQGWVALRVSVLLRQTVHPSTIGRIEKGGGLSWEYFAALLVVLGGDMDDVLWMMSEHATPAQATTRARETFKRLAGTDRRAALEEKWRAEAEKMADNEIDQELARIKTRRKPKRAPKEK